jgi:hypothetical protein
MWEPGGICSGALEKPDKFRRYIHGRIYSKEKALHIFSKVLILQKIKSQSQPNPVWLYKTGLSVGRSLERRNQFLGQISRAFSIHSRERKEKDISQS